VPELWDDSADTLVYLFPRESRRGPSFRIPSAAISSSPKLRVLAFGDSHGSLRKRARSFDGRSTLSATDATRFINQRKPHTPPYTPTVAAQDNQTSSDGSAESISSLGETTKESHLYFPSHVYKAMQGTQQFAQEEHERVVSIRNLFAFLMGRPLVATNRTRNAFSTLRAIADYLRDLGFSNVDGSTYGEVVTTSLSVYIETLALTDVASSREKTLEGIVLGESLKSMELYNEAFTHAVGKYKAVHDMKSPVWDMITPNTRNRMELAFLDLTQRQRSVKLHLSDFEFPSLFAGFADSTSSAASKVVRFKAWKSSFATLRKHTLSYYKDLHGDWPPKAKSKKNNFSVSGLNRQVLRTLYADFCTVYDLLVDRELITNRTMDAQSVLPEGEDDLVASALRTIESEYDHSCPPVQPPVPFDVPKVPTMATLDPRHNDYPEKVRLQAETRKLQMHEAILILTKSRNLDSINDKPFLKAFLALEEKEAKGKTAQELVDQRHGYWLFVYVVLQALPMLVIDAPGLRDTDGVEYFLCQPPKGGAPWMEDSRRAWYGVADSSRIVALPSDVIEHGVEAIYRRSHCWTAAEKWLVAGHCPPTIDEDGQDSALDSDSRNYDRSSSYLPEPPGIIFARNHDGLVERQGRPLSIVAESVSGSQAYESGNLSPPTQYPSSSRPRARSASNNRRSIAFGLEQLPVPPGYNISGYNMSPRTSPHLSPNLSPGHSPPLSTDQGPSGLGYGLGIANDTLSPRSGSIGSSNQSPAQVKNFDEILNAVDKEKTKSEKNRRKSFMGLPGL
jgi:hypothetical protein